MATAELKTLHSELNLLLKTVPGKAVSASKVQAVAKACFHARGEYKRAVYAVEQFIKKAPAHCRLAGVYAIDAVCRRSKAQLKEKDPFVARFGKEIGATLQCLDASSLEDRQRLVKVVCEWTKQKLFDVDFNSLAVIKRTRDDSRAALDRAEQKASPRARSPSPEPQPHQKVSRFSSQPPPPQQFGGPYAGQGPPRGFSPQGMPPQGFSNGPPQGFPPQQFPPRGMPGQRLGVLNFRGRVDGVDACRSTQVACRRGASRPSSSRRRSGSRAARPRCSSPSRRRRPAASRHKVMACSRATGAAPSAATSTSRGARSATAATRRSPRNKQHHQHPSSKRSPWWTSSRTTTRPSTRALLV